MENRISNNTSGTGPDAIIPPEIQHWNWGAFFFTFLWAIPNKAWLGILCLVPIVGFFFSFVLAARANEWSWQNREWESVEEFLRIQRIWTVAGWWIFIIIPTIILVIALFVWGPELWAFTQELVTQSL